ncbi:MAG: mechanosensitive ion channel [Isosphaeraceae bacterium]|nr:mechanosensitive ion channel [Isosphaeraceae bacterium]
MQVAKPLAARIVVRTAWFLGVWSLTGNVARGQLPGLPSVAKPAWKSDAAAKPAAAPTKDNPEATVATTSGPIDVEKPVDDGAVQENLTALLSQFPGVRSVTVTVQNGVVKLEGQVEDEDKRDEVTEFTRRVQGVRLVLNRMKTDAQVLSARQLALKVLTDIWSEIARKWLVVLVAAAFFVVFALLARLFNRYSETVLAPFVSNPLLRSVLGSFLGSLLVIAGLLIALSILNLTHVVLSIVGLASLVGLAIGFAFRDITENFIASILLGVRRPFRLGDYIQVAGQSGVVKTLNTRATVLVTLEGNHVRIPNSTIYKEILVNSSSSSSSRGTFDVVIPYSVSTATAVEAMTQALRDQEGILPDPPARALVEAFEQNGVRLRGYYWMPSQGVDGFKLNSDAKLKVKVALQQAGIAPPPLAATVAIVGKVPVDVSEVNQHSCDNEIIRPGAVISNEQAAANLRRDRHAAATAKVAPTDGHETPMEHVLSEAETHVSDEGENLLASPQPAANGVG